MGQTLLLHRENGGVGHTRHTLAKALPAEAFKHSYTAIPKQWLPIRHERYKSARTDTRAPMRPPPLGKVLLKRGRQALRATMSKVRRSLFLDAVRKKYHFSDML